jgi:RNA polymerase sigma-70 factor (ECF subfamily)
MNSGVTVDRDAQVFDQHRPVMFALAYRMLGSAMDADDVVQEAFLRWHQVPQAHVESVKAYLLTIVTRLCIDELRSARTRREMYIGPWLPEPLVVNSTADPSTTLDNADSVSFAFLLLLERLTPLERAVLILHDVFDYTYSEVALMIDAAPAYCRQLGHRARQRVALDRTRFTAAPEQVTQAAQRFLHASSDGDIQSLLDLFVADIIMYSDGGGKVLAARNPIYGADRVARFFINVRRKAQDYAARTHRIVLVNGQIGLIVELAGQVNRVYSFDVDRDGQIHTIYCVLNPDKLHRGVRGE